MAQAIIVRLLVFAGLFAPAAIWVQTAQRTARIHALAFSPDGEQLAVVRVDAKDARVPMKAYRADLARTISLVDVGSATVTRVIHRDFVPGNHGPAIEYWRWGRDAVAFDSAGKSLFVLDFSGTEIRRQDLASGASTLFFTPPPGASLAGMCLSDDRTRLAAVSIVAWNWAGIIDSQTGELLVEGYDVEANRFGGSQLALSPDNRWLAVASGPNAWLCDAQNKLERGVSIACKGAFAFVPGKDEIAAASLNTIGFFDLAGRQLQTRSSGDEIRELAFMPGGDRLIVAINESVLIQRRTDQAVRRFPRNISATALVCSPAGDLVAIGERGGSLTLWKPSDDGTRTISIPGPSHSPWPFVAALVLFAAAWVWIISEWRQGRGIFPQRLLPRAIAVTGAVLLYFTALFFV